MRLQQQNLYDSFISIIVNSIDLKLEDKIQCLEYAADDVYSRGNNLLYLEYKAAIKELHG